MRVYLSNNIQAWARRKRKKLDDTLSDKSMFRNDFLNEDVSVVLFVDKISMDPGIEECKFGIDHLFQFPITPEWDVGFRCLIIYKIH